MVEDVHHLLSSGECELVAHQREQRECPYLPVWRGTKAHLQTQI